MSYFERNDLLGYIEQVKDIKQLCDWVNDETFDIAQGAMLKCITNPGVPNRQVDEAITQLAAVAGTLQTRSKAYKTVWKSQPDAKVKYELFHSTYTGLLELVAALKYQAKGTTFNG